MYKATDTTANSPKSYLVFFDETTYSAGSNTYYVPSKTPVTVTLTIATASSSAE